MIMKTIEITMEKVIRVAHTFEVTDDEYDAILSDGRNPRHDEMEALITKCEKDALQGKRYDGDIEFDYAIADEDGRELVEWG